MYIKILLSLSVLSCTDKKIDINNHKIDKKETVQNQVKKSEEHGFLVLNKTYKSKDLLTLYNSNHSKWKSFNFNDNFQDDEIDPYAMKPENTLLIFKYLGKENGFYKVIVDENKKLIKYIKESDSNFKYQTIKDHILTVFSVEFNEKENPLRLEPTDKSKTVFANQNSFYYPIKTNENWLMVEDDNNNFFWIKWCDEKGNLILNLYYDA